MPGFLFINLRVAGSSRQRRYGFYHLFDVSALDCFNTRLVDVDGFGKAMQAIGYVHNFPSLWSYRQLQIRSLHIIFIYTYLDEAIVKGLEAALVF